MEYMYYNRYLLDDIQNWELSEADTRLLDAAIFHVDNRSTVRCTAENFGYSKSVYHRLIHTRLKKISYELYKCVLKELSEHSKH